MDPIFAKDLGDFRLLCPNLISTHILEEPH